jgi:hypothetical protein
MSEFFFIHDFVDRLFVSVMVVLIEALCHNEPMKMHPVSSPCKILVF